MRRLLFIGIIGTVLLFIPTYLWVVKGIPFWEVGRWFGENASAQTQGPSKPLQFDTTEMSDVDEMERLARTDPVRLLEESLKHYQKNVKSYTCTLVRRERIGKDLREQEVIEAFFTEEPFSVLMVWKQPQDGKKRPASATLYSTALKKDKMFVRPPTDLQKAAVAFAGGYVERAPDCREARESTRYFITDFGIRKGTERTYEAWKEAQSQRRMQFEYLGVEKLAPAGDRDCYVIRRYTNPETETDPREREEGLTEVTIYIDTQTWMQVGTVLKNTNRPEPDQLIAEYYFRDIVINPPIDAGTFKKEILKKY